jgi:hypothetical protein
LQRLGVRSLPENSPHTIVEDVGVEFGDYEDMLLIAAPTAGADSGRGSQGTLGSSFLLLAVGAPGENNDVGLVNLYRAGASTR